MITFISELYREAARRILTPAAFELMERDGISVLTDQDLDAIDHEVEVIERDRIERMDAHE